jgi:hypothetical protein
MIAVDFAFVGGAVQDAAGKVRYREPGGFAARRRRRRSRLEGVSYARLERKAIELGFAGRTGHAPRHAAHADRKSRRGVRGFAACRSPRRASIQTDVEIIRAQILSDAAARRDQPDRYRQPPLVADGVRRSSLWPPGGRHPGIGADHWHRRSQRLHAASAGARQSESRRGGRHRRRSREINARLRFRRAARTAGA